jgi:protoporphyrinogen/coproporphyrinogen III oxidase
MNNVAIVGGGITGLTVAFRLKERGIPVTIYEAGNRVGGAIQTMRRDGYLAESGPNSILETSSQISSLIHDVGLEDFKLYSNERADKRYIVRDGKLVPVPGTPVKFLTSSLFSTTAKAHLLAEPFIGRAPADKEESVEQFVLRRLGREFLNYAINPLVAGIYAGNPAQLSVKHAFPKLHALEQRYGSLLLGQFLGARERKRRGEVSKQQAKKISFPGGLQDLVDALQHQLPGCIRLNNPIQELEEIPNGWRVFSKDGMNEYGAVVLAAPAHRLSKILLKTNSAPALPFEEIKYPPIASIVLGFRRDQVPHPLDGFGVLVPEVEHMNILGAIFSSSLFPNRAPDGHVTITCFVGGCRNPELALIDQPALRHLVLEDLKRLLGVTGSPTFEHYSMFPQSIPQYDVGFGKFKELMNSIEAAAPGLYFAGHYRDGISVGDSIASAENATAKIVRHFNHSTSHPSLNLAIA